MGDLYRAESEAGETFTQFKKRKKKEMKLLNNNHLNR